MNIAEVYWYSRTAEWLPEPGDGEEMDTAAEAAAQQRRQKIRNLEFSLFGEKNDNVSMIKCAYFLVFQLWHSSHIPQNLHLKAIWPAKNTKTNWQCLLKICHIYCLCSDVATICYRRWWVCRASSRWTSTMSATAPPPRRRPSSATRSGPQPRTGPSTRNPGKSSGRNCLRWETEWPFKVIFKNNY